MAGLRILCTLGALLMMSSSLVAADGYSTFVSATKKLLGVQVPLCCCATLDNFHFDAVEQGLFATAFITSGLDPRCGLLPGPGAACAIPTPCPSYAITNVPIGIALQAPALGYVPLPPGARRKALQFTPGRDYVYDYGVTASAGSSDYVSFSSSFNIAGDLRLSNQSTDSANLNLNLGNMQLGGLNVGFTTP